MNSSAGVLVPEHSEQVAALVASSCQAQKQMLSATDAQLDQLLDSICKQVAAQRETYCKREVVDTGIGEYAAKRHKLTLVLEGVRAQLLGVKTTGPLSADDAACVEYASPLGCILAIVPLTNPVPNSLFHILNCLKTRNSLLLSFPRKARALGQMLVEQVQALLVAAELPAQAVQALPAQTDRQWVQLAMAHPDIAVIMAAGGADLVRQAQRSGNPCYGVGPGNAPVYIARSANLAQAAAAIVNSKSYDHGIVCGSENNLVVDSAIASECLAALESAGAKILTERQKALALAHWFEPDSHRLKSKCIGRSAVELLALAGIECAPEVRLVVIPAVRSEMPQLANEKLAPLVSLFVAAAEGISWCSDILQLNGAGHTAVIYSSQPEEIADFAERVPAGRLLVNCGAVFGMMGASTAIDLSFLVGSGSYGNNISTDNLQWRHYVNTKRLLTEVNAHACQWRV